MKNFYQKIINQAPVFEQRLKKENYKKLFDYIGAGTVSPKFLINKLYHEENTKLDIDFIKSQHILKKDSFSQEDLQNFLNENKDQLKIEYLDFKYAIINPLNLIGIDEFNQSFFDKIDQIEIDIANGVMFENIMKELDISQISRRISNFHLMQMKLRRKYLNQEKIIMIFLKLVMITSYIELKKLNKDRPTLMIAKQKKKFQS